MSKEIKNHFELIDICRKASSYFIGSFMLELIKRREEWENQSTKRSFLESFHQEYFSDIWSIERTLTCINCAIRIIESHRV